MSTTHTAPWPTSPQAGDIFKSGRRTMVVREVTDTHVRFSTLRANGEPFTPIYAYPREVAA